MKVSTSWSFRKKHLNYFLEEDFENAWDYFIYLHVNPTVYYLHIAGTIVGLSLFPWAMYRFFWHWEIMPTVIYTFFYYGVGFISHWIGDGQVSGTWKQIFSTYYYAVKMNGRIVRRKFRTDIATFLLKYPETKWVYFSEFEPPRDLNETSGPRSSLSQAKTSRNSDNLFTS